MATPQQVLDALARSNADLARKLDELNRSIGQAQTGIGLGLTQGLIGSLSGGVMGALRGMVVAGTGALSQGLLAGARQASQRAGLLQEESNKAMARGAYDVAHNLDQLSQEASATAGAMESFSQVAGGLGGIATALIQLPGAILEQIKGPVGLAAPHVLSTFEGNVRLLTAEIGRDLVPALQSLSRATHGLRLAYQYGRPLAQAAGGLVGGRFDPSLGPILGPIDRLAERLGLRAPEDLPQFAQSRYTKGADYFDQLQVSALNAAGQQTQQELLRLQLEEARKRGLVLEDIRNRLPGIPFSGWRG